MYGYPMKQYAIGKVYIELMLFRLKKPLKTITLSEAFYCLDKFF